MALTFAIKDTSTQPTLPLSALAEVRVLRVVFVPLTAMAALPRLAGKSSPQIFFSGNWLKMLGIAAAALAAFVVKVHAFRDRTSEQFINDAMGSLSLAMDASGSVASIADTFKPKPAPSIRLWADFAHHALHQSGISFAAHSSYFSGGAV